jgi:hypothetical protein
MATANFASSHNWFLLNYLSVLQNFTIIGTLHAQVKTETAYSEAPVSIIQQS